MTAFEDKSKQIQQLMKELCISSEKPNSGMINHIQTVIINYLIHCKKMKNTPSKTMAVFNVKNYTLINRKEKEIKSSLIFVQKLLEQNNCPYLFTFEIKNLYDLKIDVELLFKKNDNYIKDDNSNLEITGTVKNIEGAKANEEGAVKNAKANEEGQKGQ